MAMDAILFWDFTQQLMHKNGRDDRMNNIDNLDLFYFRLQHVLQRHAGSKALDLV